MYGTVFQIKVKPGQEQKLVEVFEEWGREREPKAQGSVATLLLKPDNKSGEFVGVAVFKDKETYTTNANDPEQDNWYRKMRELIQADPVWNDGEFLYTDI